MSPSPPSCAVHAVDAVAQGGVPAPLGGVQALETVGTGLLAAQVVAEAVAFADEREVASAGDVAQLTLGLRLAGALLLESAHGGVGTSHRAAPTHERHGDERQRAEDQDRGVALAHVDGDPGDEAGHDVRGDDAAAEAAPNQPARLAGAETPGCMGRRA